MIQRWLNSPTWPGFWLAFSAFWACVNAYELAEGSGNGWDAVFLVIHILLAVFWIVALELLEVEVR